MKNLIKISLVFVAAIMILASCNKEKAAVKKLDGTWTFKSQTVSETGLDCSGGGTVVDTSEVTWAFTAYDVKDAESGAAVFTYKAGPNSTAVTVPYTYAVDEKGETFKLTFLTESETYTIESLTKTEFTFSIQDSVDVFTDCATFETEKRFATTTTTLEKQ